LLGKSELKLDRVDVEIVKLCSENPGISQGEIAKRQGISQPTIALRIKKLKNLGVLAVNMGLDVFRTKLHVARVDITTTNATKIVDMFQDCPYCLNGFITSGRNNLSLFFVAEDLTTLECLVDNHLRVNKLVQSVEFNIVIDAINGLIMPLRTPAHDTRPCGAKIECKACRSFKEDKCLGCPIIHQHSGWLWPSPRHMR
jgi:Lrp/AsnC family leucine-responsive transcriptional regulator